MSRRRGWSVFCSDKLGFRQPKASVLSGPCQGLSLPPLQICQSPSGSGLFLCWNTPLAWNILLIKVQLVLTVFGRSQNLVSKCHLDGDGIQMLYRSRSQWESRKLNKRYKSTIPPLSLSLRGGGNAISPLEPIKLIATNICEASLLHQILYGCFIYVIF